jgi:protein-S-isoprenylcysteine O-methyltransferase Ste14
MAMPAKMIINICWGLFLLVWVVAALFTKRTIYRQGTSERFRYMIPIVVGWFLLFRGQRLPAPLNLRVIPQTDELLTAAAILCVVGVAICLWARAVLGRNWSGIVTLKEEHELVLRGPYRFVRHPIYTGLLTMLTGTAIYQGHLGGIIGMGLVFVSLWIKLIGEEGLMLKQFPDQYPEYQLRVNRLIPFIL